MNLSSCGVIAPPAGPVPVDSRSNDRWFQHVAVIVSDMDEAYAWLRQNHVEHALSGPQTAARVEQECGGHQGVLFQDPDGHPVEILQFPPGKGEENGSGQR